MGCQTVCFVSFAIISGCLGFGLLVGGYYPAVEAAKGNIAYPDECLFTGGCTCGDGVHCNCMGYITSSGGVGNLNYNPSYYAGQNMPETVACYINRCCPAFGDKDFYWSNCSLVQQNFYPVFLDQQLDYNAYLISGLVFTGITALIVIVMVLNNILNSYLKNK